MNDLSLTVYGKNVNNLFIVNKLVLIYLTWFAFTFLNYKYNVLLKRDDVCLIPLRNFVTLSYFNEGKETRIALNKMT